MVQNKIEKFRNTNRKIKNNKDFEIIRKNL